MTTINKTSQEEDFLIDKFTCDSPALPSNVNVTFPNQLLTNISSFQNLSNTKKTRRENKKIVEEYLVKQGKCSSLNPDIVQDFKLRIFRINSHSLDDILSTEKALNANIHDDLACAVDAIIYDNNPSGGTGILQRERVRNWFTSLKQIGPETVEGYALRASFDKDTDLFVIKAPRDPTKDELVHEAMVGFYAMNKLRHILPNYMYVYGYVKCSPPAINNREVISWCSSGTPAMSYLIVENIRDAVSIGDFIINPETTPLDVLVVIYQVINALNLAYKTYGYTHYDLHHGNIMVRKYKKMVAIPYFGTSDQVIGYLVSRYVPYIIDYGYSRITVGGVGFGIIGLESAGIESRRAFPMYDIYKLISFLTEKVSTNKPTAYFTDILALLDKFFSFFNEGSVIERVRKRLTYGNDWYGAKEVYRKVTHDDYISWLENNSAINIPVHVNISNLTKKGIYTAPINTNLDTCMFYEMISSDNGPRNSLEYCEARDAIGVDKSLSPELKQEALDWLNNNFDAESYFLGSYDYMVSKLRETMTIKQNYNLNQGNIIYNISKVINLVDQTNNYKKRIISLIKIKDIVSEVISYIKSNICSLISQGTYKQHSDKIRLLNNTATNLVEFINKQRAILEENLNFAKTINWNLITNNKADLSFWNSEHEKLIISM